MYGWRVANTLIYTQLVEFEEDDKYCPAVADNVEAAQKLLKTGYEYLLSQRANAVQKTKIGKARAIRSCYMQFSIIVPVR